LQQARMQRAIDWAIVTGRRLPQEQRIGHDAGIEAGADHVLLVLLEGFGRIERGREPHEQRMRVRRQALRQMIGGLIVSQALTLFATPVVYLYLDNLSNAAARWAKTRRTAKPPAKADTLKDAAE
jgi:hypothetical protein